ncbi:MAG: hypothetical protein ACI9SP_001123 [Arenicella sp.]|jgi:hypothetical protein
MKNRREILKASIGSGAVLVAMPSKWTSPVMNSIILPAHAQTSGSTSSPVNESISIDITATEISGPIVIARSGSSSFSGSETVLVGQCKGTSDLSLRVDFSGTLDSANSQITGAITLTQRCGSDLVCEQLSTFTVTQSPLDLGSDIGNYTGTLTGTLVCQDGFDL